MHTLHDELILKKSCLIISIIFWIENDGVRHTCFSCNCYNLINIRQKTENISLFHLTLWVPTVLSLGLTTWVQNNCFVTWYYHIDHNLRQYFLMLPKLFDNCLFFKHKRPYYLGSVTFIFFVVLICSLLLCCFYAICLNWFICLSTYFMRHTRRCVTSLPDVVLYNNCT